MIFIIFGAFLPFILWPIEYFLPYPHVIEEVAKAIIIIFLLNNISERSTRICYVVIIGILFALSESVLYLFNIMLVGSSWDFVARLLLTIPLHAGTSLIILISAMKKRVFIGVGLSIAILIHYIFNLLVGRI